MYFWPSVFGTGSKKTCSEVAVQSWYSKASSFCAAVFVFLYWWWCQQACQSIWLLRKQLLCCSCLHILCLYLSTAICRITIICIGFKTIKWDTGCQLYTMLRKMIFNPYKQKGLKCWVFVSFNALRTESRIMHVCFGTKQTHHNHVWDLNLLGFSTYVRKYMCCLKAELHQQWGDVTSMWCC